MAGHGSSAIPVLALLLAGTATLGDAQVRSDTIIRRAGAPRHLNVATLAAEVRIGGNTSDTTQQLDRVKQILPTASATLWVLESSQGSGMTFSTVGSIPTGASRLSVYSESGSLLRRVGRRGQGPGEWQTPNDLQALPDGRVLLADGSLANRFTFFSADGLLDTIWTFPNRHTTAPVDAQGFIWRWVMDLRPGVSGMAQMPRMVQMIVAPNGSVVGDAPTLRVQGIAHSSARVEGKDKKPSSAVYLYAPFEARSNAVWSPLGYFASVVTSTYAINLHVPRNTLAGTFSRWREGDPILSIRRDVPPVVVSDAERHDQMAYLEARAKYAGGSRSGPLPAIPRTKPPIQAVRFDYEGRMWVHVHVASERFTPPAPRIPRGRKDPPPVLGWREPHTFDVFEREGTYVGRVVLPSSAMLPITLVPARGDKIWLVEQGEDDIESIVRYRIVW
jgi:hypothetical protein